MNRIDPTGNTRLSTNLTVERQTPKSDFGDRIQSGLNSATGAIANGLAVAAPVVPGASILSAAVSSLNTMSQTQGVTAQYAATGVVAVGGGGGGMSTTVGGPGGAAVGGLGTGMPTAGSVVGNGGSVVGASLGNAGSGLAEQAGQLGQMLQVQMQVQRENQVFTTVSNVLKTRHDTIKNTISNVR